MNQPEIVRRVLDYLAAHPAAEDTLRGITEWWILREKVGQAVEEVESALSELVRRKLIVAVQGEDGQTRYRLNRRRKQEEGLRELQG